MEFPAPGCPNSGSGSGSGGALAINPGVDCPRSGSWSSPIFYNLSFPSCVFCRSWFCWQWQVHFGLVLPQEEWGALAVAESRPPAGTGPSWVGWSRANGYWEDGAFPLIFERPPWKLTVYLVSLALTCLIAWFPVLVSLFCSVWWEKKDSLWTAEEVPWEARHPL